MAKQANRMMIGGFVVLAVIIMGRQPGCIRFGQILQENQQIYFCTSMNPSRGWLWAHRCCSRAFRSVGDRHYSPSRPGFDEDTNPRPHRKSSRTDGRWSPEKDIPGMFAAKLGRKGPAGPS